MRKQRCPTDVLPVACVPRLIVQYSRITVVSPTSTQVSSPLYFRSWGSLPSTLRSEEHTSELQSRLHLVCRLLLEKKKDTSTLRGAGSRSTQASPDFTTHSELSVAT